MQSMVPLASCETCNPIHNFHPSVQADIKSALCSEIQYVITDRCSSNIHSPASSFVSLGQLNACNNRLSPCLSQLQFNVVTFLFENTTLKLGKGFVLQHESQTVKIHCAEQECA